MRKAVVSIKIKTKSGKRYELYRFNGKEYITLNDGIFSQTYRVCERDKLSFGRDLNLKYYALTSGGVLKKYAFCSNEPIIDMTYNN